MKIKKLSYMLDWILNIPLYRMSHPTKKMKFFIKDFFSECYQIRRNLRIWSHLVKKFLMENFIFCAMSIPGTRQFTESLNQLIPITNEDINNNFTMNMRWYWSVRLSCLGLIFILKMSFKSFVAKDIIMI